MAKQRFDQINMIPFIDIMLVLLAIVLTTASFVSQGLIPIDLPEASLPETQTSDAGASTLALTIDQDNQLYWPVSGATEEMSMVDLSQATERLKSLPTATHVTLQIDKRADFGQFVGLYDVLKSEGFEHIAIEAETR